MSIVDELRTGDMRTIGTANSVVTKVLEKPALVGELVGGLSAQEAGVRMRCADVLEKVALHEPEFVQRYKNPLLQIAQHTQQQEIQWHMAQIFERLSLTEHERQKLVPVFTSYITTSKSNIVKVFSLQTLTTWAVHDDHLRPQVRQLLQEAINHGAASVVNRGKKLLEQLNQI